MLRASRVGGGTIVDALVGDVVSLGGQDFGNTRACTAADRAGGPPTTSHWAPGTDASMGGTSYELFCRTTQQWAATGPSPRVQQSVRIPPLLRSAQSFSSFGWARVSDSESGSALGYPAWQGTCRGPCPRAPRQPSSGRPDSLSALAGSSARPCGYARHAGGCSRRPQ